ncbi:MAG: metal-dependent hydrolase [Porticoccaceae bacterium]
MDTLSHALLGAAIGQLTLGRRCGNKAVLTGALVALLPDIDVAVGKLLGDAAALTFHRGITHSIVFALLAALLLGRLLARDERASWRHWSLLCGAVLSSHLLLDAFTSYGIQLLLPFSNHSFAIASISVIDPLYTLPLLLVVLVFPWLRGARARQALAGVGVMLASAYLALTLYNKQAVTAQFEDALRQQGVAVQRLFVKPTMFNNLLWRGIAETDDGYRVGFFSLLDTSGPADFVHFSRREELLAGHSHAPLVRDLLKVSDGYFQVESIDDTLYFHDLRYGKAFEWLRDDRPHVFTYRLREENGEIVDLDAINLAVDRERDRRTFHALVQRAKGL